MLSTHFKSKDLGRILTEQGQGHFWHAVFLNGAVIVNQDEGTEWTVVQTTPHDADLKAVLEAMDPPKFIYGALGGIGKPYEFEIDEMLTKYVWKADLAIADSFRSSKGRVFLAGDAAHQITPVGGHGMNSGVQDVYDLTWKLDAVLRGYGGDTLLDSYTFERRKIAELNVSQAEKGAMELMLPMFMNAAKYSPEQILAQNQEGEEIRKELKAPMENGHWLHNQNGIILGYRYNGSPILVPDSSPEPPESSVTEYTPTTWPGSRAPHVFLNDGKTSVFDLYGSGFTIVDFSPKGETSDMFGEAASSLDIPISKLHLPEEKHCRQVWERDVVLVRPDGVVAWRVPEGGNWQADKEAVTSILRTAVGKS